MQDFAFTPEYLKLQIFPWDIDIEYPKGEKLMKALNRGGVFFKDNCDRRGSCNKCKVEVFLQNSFKQKELLACKAELQEDAQVRVPPENVMDD